MGFIIAVIIEISIIAIVLIYLVHHLVKDLRKYIPFWYKKWVKGECRHLCVLCNHSDICEGRVELEVEWKKGFNEGYDAGVEDGKMESDCSTCFEREYCHSQGYKEGYEQGKNDTVDKVIELIQKK